jgi:DNA-binding NarL/FixJ family response regulator
MIRDKLPDIAVVDIAMPGLNGIAVARRLASECPSVRVVILTFYEEQSFVKQALAAGVRGYVLKRSAAENLVEATRAVVRGEIYIDPLLADDLPGGVVSSASKASQASEALGLTDRETSVLKSLARGLTSKEIAARLDLSVKTVDTYKARATEKLQLKTRAEIVRFGLAQGWLEEV